MQLNKILLPRKVEGTDEINRTSENKTILWEENVLLQIKQLSLKENCASGSNETPRKITRNMALNIAQLLEIRSCVLEALELYRRARDQSSQ
jgi:hypothetical protein